MKIISYDEMQLLWKKGIRNGVIHRLDAIRRGLFSAALCYSRMMGRISNARLIEAVESIADRISNTLGRRILRKGIERASQLRRNQKIARHFPIMADWLSDRSFILWLGTDLLVRRSWIIFGARP